MAQISNDSYVRLLTEAGIAALRNGDKQRSRELFKQALQADPGYVPAWLWLSGSVDSDAGRRRCLQKVLAIDPYHAAARRGLQKLGVRLRPLPSAAAGASDQMATTANERRARSTHWFRQG